MPRHCGLNPGRQPHDTRSLLELRARVPLVTPSGAGIGTCGQEVATLPGSADTRAFSLNLVLGNTPSQGEYRYHFISHCNNNWFRKESSINAKMIDIYTLKYLPIRYIIITMGKITAKWSKSASSNGTKGVPGGSGGKESSCSATWVQSLGWGIPWRGHGSPLQCSCLEPPMDRGAWRAAVPGATQSWTHTHIHDGPEGPCVSWQNAQRSRTWQYFCCIPDKSA